MATATLDDAMAAMDAAGDSGGEPDLDAAMSAMDAVPAKPKRTPVEVPQVHMPGFWESNLKPMLWNAQGYEGSAIETLGALPQNTMRMIQGIGHALNPFDAERFAPEPPLEENAMMRSGRELREQAQAASLQSDPEQGFFTTKLPGAMGAFPLQMGIAALAPEALPGAGFGAMSGLGAPEGHRLEATATGTALGAAIPLINQAIPQAGDLAGFGRRTAAGTLFGGAAALEGGGPADVLSGFGMGFVGQGKPEPRGKVFPGTTQAIKPPEMAVPPEMVAHDMPPPMPVEPPVPPPQPIMAPQEAMAPPRDLGPESVNFHSEPSHVVATAPISGPAFVAERVQVPPGAEQPQQINQPTVKKGKANVQEELRERNEQQAIGERELSEVPSPEEGASPYGESRENARAEQGEQEAVVNEPTESAVAPETGQPPIAKLDAEYDRIQKQIDALSDADEQGAAGKSLYEQRFAVEDQLMREQRKPFQEALAEHGVTDPKQQSRIMEQIYSVMPEGNKAATYFAAKYGSEALGQVDTPKKLAEMLYRDWAESKGYDPDLLLESGVSGYTEQGRKDLVKQFGEQAQNIHKSIIGKLTPPVAEQAPTQADMPKPKFAGWLEGYGKVPPNPQWTLGNRNVGIPELEAAGVAVPEHPTYEAWKGTENVPSKNPEASELRTDEPVPQGPSGSEGIGQAANAPKSRERVQPQEQVRKLPGNPFDNMVGGNLLNRIANKGGIRDSSGELDNLFGPKDKRLKGMVLRPNSGKMTIGGIGESLHELGRLPSDYTEADVIEYIRKNAYTPHYIGEKGAAAQEKHTAKQEALDIERQAEQDFEDLSYEAANAPLEEHVAPEVPATKSQPEMFKTTLDMGGTPSVDKRVGPAEKAEKGQGELFETKPTFDAKQQPKLFGRGEGERGSILNPAEAYSSALSGASKVSEKANEAFNRRAVAPIAAKVKAAASKVGEHIPDNIKRTVRNLTQNEFQQIPELKAVNDALKETRSKAAGERDALIRTILSDTAGRDELLAADRVMRGHPLDIDNIPQATLDKLNTTRDALRERAQDFSRQRAALGLSTREQWNDGDKFWYPNLFNKYELRKVGGKFFSLPSIRKGIALSAEEAGHSKQRVTDQYRVVNAKTGKSLGAFPTEAEAQAFFNKQGGGKRFGVTYSAADARGKAQRVSEYFSTIKERNDFINSEKESGSLRVDENMKVYNTTNKERMAILHPMTPEQLRAFGLVENVARNISRGFGSAEAEVHKVKAFDDMASILQGDKGKDLFMSYDAFEAAPNPDFVKVKDLGLKMPFEGAAEIAGRGKASKNANIESFLDGAVRQDLAQDLRGLYGKDGWITALSKALYAPDQALGLRNWVTYRNPFRHPRQLFENELSLYLADSTASADIPARSKAIAEFFQHFVSKKTSPHMKEFADSGILETDFLHSSEMENLANELGPMATLDELRGNWFGKLTESRAGRAVKSVDDLAKTAYHMEDAVYKYQYYKTLRERGFTQAEAKQRVLDYMFDWSNAPRLVKNLRFIPFAPSVAWQFTRIFGNQLKNNPVTFPAKLALTMTAALMLRGALDKQQGVKPADRQGDQPKYRNSQFVLPMTDSKGRDLAFDARFLLPFNELFNIPTTWKQERGAVRSMLPMWLQGPATVATNQDRFGNPIIWDNTKNPAKKHEQNVKMAQEVIGSFMPGIAGQYWLNQWRNAEKPANDPNKQDWIVPALTRPAASIAPAYIPKR